MISANILNRGGYVVYPCESMTNHIGFGDGVNCTVKTLDYMAPLCSIPIDVRAEVVQEDPEIVRSLHRWLLKTHLKLLVKYLVTLGPLKKYFGMRIVNGVPQ